MIRRLCRRLDLKRSLSNKLDPARPQRHGGRGPGIEAKAELRDDPQNADLQEWLAFELRRAKL
jgi:hypothetical protein